MRTKKQITKKKIARLTTSIFRGRYSLSLTVKGTDLNFQKSRHSDFIFFFETINNIQSSRPFTLICLCKTKKGFVNAVYEYVNNPPF